MFDKIVEVLNKLGVKNMYTINDDGSIDINDIVFSKWGVQNYIINDDGMVDSHGDVNLSHCNLIEIPFKFRRVTGNFYCGSNHLSSLKNSPEWVGGNFYCGYNKLTTLEGAPLYIGGEFICESEISRQYKEYVRDKKLKEILEK